MEIINFLLGLLRLSPEMGFAIFGALFAVSEALSLIPALKSNSVFQLIYNSLKKLAGK